jgi:hypothetical protein
MPGTVFLRLDISGDTPPEPYLPETGGGVSSAERFKENGMGYAVNGVEYNTIYGLTVTAAKRGGTKTEVRIHRIIRNGEAFSSVIESLTVTARLFRDCYERRRPGMFRLSFSKLLLMADETAVNSSGAVIGPLRYYAAGPVMAEVYSESNK